MHHFMWSAFGVILAAAVAMSSLQAQPRRTAADRVSRFRQLDRNGDGKLSPAELPYRNLRDRLDRNRDGQLSQEEVVGAPSAPTGSPAAVYRLHRDLRYARLPGVAPNDHSLDLYIPTVLTGSEGQGKTPVLVMVHGGGWRGGDKKNAPVGADLAGRYCPKGFVFASVNYRLTPQGRHPANVRDVARALAWLDDHVGEYGGDPNQISLMGHSAGAHLAALVATDERHLEAEKKSLHLIKRVILLDTAAYDLPRRMRESGRPGMRGLYQQAFGADEATWRDASPAAHVEPGKGIPPMLIFCSGGRPSARELADDFAQALTAAGAPSHVIEAADLDHAGVLRMAAAEHPLARSVLAFLCGDARAISSGAARQGDSPSR